MAYGVPRITSMPTHPRNVPGEFWVENDCCTLCGVPWNIAPELFAHDDSGCWVAKQPGNDDERRKMLKVIDSQEFDCIRRRDDGTRL